MVMGRGSAAAHRWQEGDFVAGVEWRVPGGEFLIAGGDERRAELCELGMARGIESEELLDRCGAGGVHRFFGEADDFFQAAKEEDFDTNGLGNGGHRRIVTRWQEWG